MAGDEACADLWHYVIEKKVSVEAAKKDYGVVVVSDGVHYQVDEQATKALRG